MTIDEWLRAAAARLNTDSARLDVELLLGHALGHTRAGLYARLRDSVDTDAQRAADALLARRVRGEPIAYITGVREFSALPKTAQDYVLRIEKLIHCRIRYVSVGPERESLIDRGMA